MVDEQTVLRCAKIAAVEMETTPVSGPMAPLIATITKETATRIHRRILDLLKPYEDGA
jgi:hypothetical protein